MDVTGQKLSLQAEALMRHLRFRVGKNRFCWHKQETIAAELGVGLNYVRKYLRVLVGAGLAEIVRTGRANKCFIPPRTEAESADQIGAKAPIRSAQKRRSDRRKSADQIGAKAPIARETTLDEKIKRKGEKESAPPPVADGLEDEHPRVRELVLQRRKFDSLPDRQRVKIEEAVRREKPLLAFDEQSLRDECVNAMIEAEGRPYLRFVGAFTRQVSCCPKDTAFLFDWEPRFERISATLEEMLFGLEAWLEDPRRSDNRWEGRFAKDAFWTIRRAILERRKASSKKGDEARPATSAPPKQSKPLDFEEFGPCADVAREICGLIGESSYALWFAGKVSMQVNGGLVRIATKQAFIRDWVKKTFLAKIVQAVAKIDPGWKVEIICEP